MNRYNIFGMIHKGLRAMLYDTAIRLQQTDFNEQEQCTGILNQVSEVLSLFEKHADTEDNFILNRLHSTDPAIAGMFEEEHIEDYVLTRNLRQIILTYEAAHTEEERIAGGEQIRKAFVAFLIFNLKHMDKEENELNLILWKHFTDEQLHRITEEIIAHVPTYSLASYNYWMLRGLSNYEISRWLSQVKDEAPQELFRSLLGMAYDTLPSERWDRIQAEITEGAMLVS